jgi:hypothetical protein
VIPLALAPPRHQAQPSPHAHSPALRLDQWEPLAPAAAVRIASPLSYNAGTTNLTRFAKGNAFGFKPGESGNPGGRPKSDVVSLARQHTPEAINRLVALMRQDDDLDIALAATSAIIDRGWGRPVQMVTGNPDQPVSFEIVWGPAKESQAPTIDATVNASGGAEGEAEAQEVVVWGDGTTAK